MQTTERESARARARERETERETEGEGGGGGEASLVPNVALRAGCAGVAGSGRGGSVRGESVGLGTPLSRKGYEKGSPNSSPSRARAPPAPASAAPDAPATAPARAASAAIAAAVSDHVVVPPHPPPPQPPPLPLPGVSTLVAAVALADEAGVVGRIDAGGTWATLVWDAVRG